MDKFPHQYEEAGDEEEKEHSHKSDSPQIRFDEPETLHRADENVLAEFKKKYQKSLEAIQSFQEILELKKNYGAISHSYHPVNFSISN